MANYYVYQFKKDIQSNWEASNPVLRAAEPGYDLTNKRLKMGDGTTPWKALPYVDPEIVDDLTTGGSDKALSAEQGKELKAMIENIDIPEGATYSVATQSANGLMSAADKKKLDGMAASANNYTHPSYTSRTGNPTSNQNPSFGGSFTISQVTSDSTGHVTGMNNRTITIPGAVATTSAAGLMSASDKSKLNGIAEGANKVNVSSETWTFTLSSGSTVTKKVAIMS